MKAIVRDTYGSTDVLQLTEVARPVIGEKDILIKVMAATVNRTDCAFLEGKPFLSRLFSGLIKPRQRILGNEFAGIIEATGKHVKAFIPGDRVFGYDDEHFGGHAEYIVVKEDAAVATIPSGYNFIQAVPLTEGSHYALCNLRAARVTQGQHVLINGATGAIGSAAVQLSKYFGATVTAVCHTAHTALVCSLGADKVIDYAREDFTLLPEKFDLVFDAVGKSSFAACKSILKEKGIYVSTELGAGWQNPFLALITSMQKGKKVIFPIPSISQSDVIFLKELAEQGSFKPLADRHYPFADIPAAYQYVMTGQKTGSVVIDMNAQSFSGV